ncbi:MAG: hypothetical protein IPI73_02695 [Betaproteobacteria bacterium]|nr:hypothetical protein [Betaproteobacteria bacterium]
MKSSVCVTIASISNTVGLEALAQAAPCSTFGTQAHPRQRRLQIVRHRGEQARAFVDEPDQARLHGVERTGGPADLGGAAFRQRQAIDVAAEIVGGPRRADAAGASPSAPRRPEIAMGSWIAVTDRSG